MRAKEFIPASKPRNFVAKNQQTAGAGVHRDKKKEQKQGYEKHKGKGVAEGYGTREFEVDGYTYMTDLDREEDNQKIWHMIKTPDGKTVNIDFTPYQYMSKDDVEFYIKLDMPKRQGAAPLDSEQLQKMAQIKGVAMLDPKMARAGMSESISFDQCPHCRGPIFHESMMSEKQDACYHKVRSRYKVWPSAYASGALVQCRKKGAKNWGNKSKK